MTAPFPVHLGLALNPDQGRLLMEALGERPFRTVHALIGRLNAWASQAFPPDPSPQQAPATVFVLTLGELELALDALGDLPHRHVFRLIGSLQGQLQALRQPPPVDAGPGHG